MSNMDGHIDRLVFRRRILIFLARAGKLRTEVHYRTNFAR
jgi:hypothetical protein